MQSQKLENLLNQALNATESERERSQELNVGYNPVDQVWELIIKYSGNLETVRQISERVTELLNEYAIIHTSVTDTGSGADCRSRICGKTKTIIFPGTKWETGVLYQ